MKKSLLLVLSLCGLCLLSACGGGGGGTSAAGGGGGGSQLPATHFSVNGPASATAGVAFNITVTALNASNNTATSYSGTVHFTSTDG